LGFRRDVRGIERVQQDASTRTLKSRASHGFSRPVRHDVIPDMRRSKWDVTGLFGGRRPASAMDHQRSSKLSTGSDRKQHDSAATNPQSPLCVFRPPLSPTPSGSFGRIAPPMPCPGTETTVRPEAGTPASGRGFCLQRYEREIPLAHRPACPAGSLGRSFARLQRRRAGRRGHAGVGKHALGRFRRRGERLSG
jgi:hypothetical protein